MNLDNQGISSFYPQFTRGKVVRGKRTSVTEPIFPSYLFVALDRDSNFNSVRSTRGVIDFVRIGHTPIVVPDTLVINLMSRSKTSALSQRLLALLPQLPEPGDRVEIIDGVYKGVEAIFQKSDGLERSILLIRLLNKEVPLALNNDEFKGNGD